MAVTQHLIVAAVKPAQTDKFQGIHEKIGLGLIQFIHKQYRPVIKLYQCRIVFGFVDILGTSLWLSPF